MAGWLVSRCGADVSATALPVLVRERIRRIFEELTSPQPTRIPRGQVAPVLKWGLCDVYVNGRASAAICAVMGDVAVPVFVVPVAPFVLHNGRGDALRVRPNWLTSMDAPPSNVASVCPCNVCLGGPLRGPRRKRGDRK